MKSDRKSHEFPIETPGDQGRGRPGRTDGGPDTGDRLIHGPILCLCLTAMFLAPGCVGESRREGRQAVQAPVELNVPAPTTYCEKTWACSYENLVQDEARRAMVQKRKAFVTACEDALRRMPEDLVKKYEGCTRVACGDELRSCLLQQVPAMTPKPE